MSEHCLYIWQDRVLYAGSGTVTSPHGHYAAALLLSCDQPFEVRYDFKAESGYAHSFETRAVLLTPHFYHQLKADRSRLIVLHLDPDSVDYEPLAELYPPDSFHHFAIEPFEASLQEGLRLWEESLPASQADRIYRSLLQKIMPAGFELAQRPGLRQMDQRIAGIVQELQKEIPESVRASELAARVELSEHRFMHLFKQEMGLPLRRYLLWLRIRRAALSMKDGGTLTEAAHAAGFSDSAHMSRIFKENFGMQPSFFMLPSDLMQVHFCAEDQD